MLAIGRISIRRLFSKKEENTIQSGTTQITRLSKQKAAWFRKGDQYWSSCEATNNGVLGGYGHLHDIDINCSRTFLNNILQTNPQASRGRAIDCGAGIGRVTKQLLSGYYNQVDLFDQCEKYVQAAKVNLKDIKNIGSIQTSGLQNYKFRDKYDCIWIQWALCYLPDDDASDFLCRVKQALTPFGFIVIKQNQYQKDIIIDKQDCSLLRSHQRHTTLFQKCNLTINKVAIQQNWPRDLQQVRMYCLQ